MEMAQFAYFLFSHTRHTLSVTTLTYHMAARTLSAVCAPFATTAAILLLLTYIFVLYQPSFGPGGLQKVGWQSWDLVIDTIKNHSTGSPATPASDDKPVDWWNVSSPDDTIDTASFPLDVWQPLLPYDTGRKYANFNS